MKNILIIFSILLLTSISAWAQPSLLIGEGVGDNGDEVCVDFSVRDFTLITAMNQLVFTWDPSEITFNQVQNFNLTGLSAANFVADVPAGTLTLNWEDVNCLVGPQGGGETLADDVVIFQLCFITLGIFGDVADINILGDPQPMIQREGDCTNIFSFRNTGHIFTGVTPVIFTGSDISGNTGDLVCMDLKVEGFDNMVNGQFTLEWDETLAAIESVIPGDVGNLAPSSFNTGIPGKLTMSWASVIDEPETVDDGTTFFEICFRLIGECEMNTQLVLGTSPTPLEFTNENGGQVHIPTFIQGGAIEIGSCDQNGLQLFADCGGPYLLNDEFCVPITVGDNFQNMSDFGFPLNWSSSILEYQGVQNVNASILGLDGSDFTTTNTGNGILRVDWSKNVGGFPNEDLNAGDVLFEVCFKVVGLGGNSPVNFIQNTSNAQVDNGSNIGISPNNCEAVITQPNQVVMVIGEGEAATGESFCIPIEVSNFQNIIGYQFQLNWDDAFYEFNSVTSINLSSVTEAGNFIIGDDAILFNWETVTPVSLADGTSIFELCFTPLSGPGNCEDIFMVEDGILVPEAIASDSNGENVGIVSTPGELCTLFPEGFGLTAVDTIGDWNGNTCMTFTVASFDNITSATFAINWDVAALNYTGLNDFGALTNLNFVPDVGVGLLFVSWADAGGVMIADDTAIFEVCFDLIGAPRDCYDVSIDDDANAPEITTLDGQGSLVIEDGEICIEEHFYITDTIITPVTCFDACDGTITLEVLSSEGTAGLNFQWDNPAQFTPYEAINLCEGEVTLTIYDNGNPRHSQMVSFEVPIVDNLPEADAGDDKELDCVAGLVAISGVGTAGAEFAYSWVKVPGNEIVGTGASTFANAAGMYAFVTTNTDTGCAVRDTMQVFPPIYPDAEAGDDLLFDCLSDTLELNGVGSSEGATINYLWTVESGSDAGVVEGDENNIDPRVTGPGVYQLEVTNAINGCPSYDIVTVVDFRNFPDATANLGLEEISLACDTTITLDADSSLLINPPLGIVEYKWYDILNQEIGNTPTIPINELGTFYLEVVNVISMCTARDTIQIVPNEDFPQITTLPDTLLTCGVDMIQLVTAIDAGDDAFTFSWISLDGGPLVAGTEGDLSPVADAPGIYQIEAVNSVSNCTATAEITIIIDTIPPVANAGLDTIISCIIDEIILDGSDSDQGVNISYTWRNEAGEVIGNEITTIITEGGIYCLEAKNNLTGCFAIDCVNVEANNIDPIVSILEPNQFLTCLVDTLMLTPDEIVPASDDYLYSWTATLGTIIGADDELSIKTAVGGIYRVSVMNPETGCTGENEFVVLTDIVLPIVNAGDDNNITCANTTITIGDETTEMGDGIEYGWSNIVDGEMPSPNDEKMAMISTPGTYELTVLNTNTGCAASDTIVVGEDMVPPVISTDVAGMITCSDECTEVTVTVDGVDDFTVSWVGLDGGEVTDNTSAEATVCELGMYEVTVIDESNGCETKDTVTVEGNVEMSEIILDEIEDFKCSDDFVVIDAAGTGPLADFSAIVWTTETGNSITPSTGSLTVNVGGPGEYTITLTRADNGCESVALISVNDDTVPPNADAGMDVLVDCGDTELLDGSNSDQGADIEYLWSVVDGGLLSGDLTSLTPTVEGEGMYELLVTNNSNGCSATDVVASNLVYPAVASAMEDITICNDSIKIEANLPDGVTGVWSVATFIQLVDETSNSTIATELSSGENQFIWTLSTNGCLDYSSDTVVIISVGDPIANTDIFELAEGEQNVSGNIVSNDIKPENWEVTLLTNPGIGMVDSLVNGVIYFSVGAGVSGETEFTYMICSLDCPGKCDEGVVLINIPASNEDIETPNTITPNGDGLNDVFFIEQIANNPEEAIPDNEIIVFNRWGDIVYQAKPYNNDWNGTNQNGQDLPEGTYYYLLRLNISEGEILKGDVTIIK